MERERDASAISSGCITARRGLLAATSTAAALAGALSFPEATMYDGLETWLSALTLFMWLEWEREYICALE